MRQKGRKTKNRKNKQRGGFTPTPTPTHGISDNTIRTVKLVHPNQPYPLEGMPQFPPDFMTDGSCSIM